MARSNALAKMMKWEQFVTIQAHYNLLERDVERELIPLLRVGERRRPAVFSTGGLCSLENIRAANRLPKDRAARSARM
ncbi:MAG: hypothetical protein U0X93_12575 [Anaerolineales bacterium]